MDLYDSDPQGPESLEMKARISQIQNASKRLEMEMKRIDTFYDTYQTEQEAAQKVLELSIAISFACC